MLALLASSRGAVTLVNRECHSKATALEQSKCRWRPSISKAISNPRSMTENLAVA
jgi:hypothetical protein